MAFSNWADFFAMGGHGFYVWSAYGFTLMIFLGCIFHGKKQAKKLIQRVKKMKGRAAHASHS